MFVFIRIVTRMEWSPNRSKSSVCWWNFKIELKLELVNNLKVHSTSKWSRKLIYCISRGLCYFGAKVIQSFKFIPKPDPKSNIHTLIWIERALQSYVFGGWRNNIGEIDQRFFLRKFAFLLGKGVFPFLQSWKCLCSCRPCTSLGELNA